MPVFEDDKSPETWGAYRLLVIRELERLSHAVTALDASVADLKVTMLKGQTEGDRRGAETTSKVNLLWTAIGAIGTILLGAVAARFIGH